MLVVTGSFQIVYFRFVEIVISFYLVYAGSLKHRRVGPVRSAGAGGCCWSGVRGKHCWLASGCWSRTESLVSCSALSPNFTGADIYALCADAWFKVYRSLIVLCVPRIVYYGKIFSLPVVMHGHEPSGHILSVGFRLKRISGVHR